jgi:hypothetical protein
MKPKPILWKELPKDVNICGLILYVPKKWQLDQGIPHERMYVFSGWFRGLWLKADPCQDRIYPLTVESFKDIDNWKVLLPYEIPKKTKRKKK